MNKIENVTSQVFCHSFLFVDYLHIFESISLSRNHFKNFLKLLDMFLKTKTKEELHRLLRSVTTSGVCSKVSRFGALGVGASWSFRPPREIWMVSVGV